MTSSLPPPVTKGPSAGVMIGASVVMLLVVGALLYWRLGGSDDAPQQAAPVVVQEPKRNLNLDAPPPPPPPIEEETAPAASDTPKKPAAPAGPSGCSGTCSGTPSPALQSMLRTKAAGARGCYERALRLNSMLAGKVTVRVRVSPSGRPCGASVVENTLGDPTVVSCITRGFMSGSYPAPEGGCADVNVPVNFTQKQ